jgi:hypothetical protein
MAERGSEGEGGATAALCAGAWSKTTRKGDGVHHRGVERVTWSPLIEGEELRCGARRRSKSYQWSCWCAIRSSSRASDWLGKI